MTGEIVEEMIGCFDGAAIGLNVIGTFFGYICEAFSLGCRGA